MGKRKHKILLHICCIGCGAFIARELKSDYKITLFFYNPNIYPEAEYERRLKETEDIANEFKLDLMIGDYDHEVWLEKVKGFEKEPERGERCRICYFERLGKTASMAAAEAYDFFTTTLTVSPHKDAKIINELGNELARKYGIEFLDKDFKKQDGFKKACKLSKELGLYRQDYCGCEFSNLGN